MVDSPNLPQTPKGKSQQNPNVPHNEPIAPNEVGGSPTDKATGPKPEHEPTQPKEVDSVGTKAERDNVVT